MTIKSQDDLNKPETHSTEVLLSTIEELERTKKQLEIAVDAMRQIIREYFSCSLIKNTRINGYEIFKLCDKACKKIEEIEKWED